MDKKGSVLLIGSFFAGNGTRQVCQDLAEQLTASGWCVHTISKRKQRLWRLIDISYRVWSWRFRYQVAHIDVFSGLSFIWAEVAAAALTKLKKPFILTLHGGNLPSFSREQPQRVQHMLSQASIVTTPSNYLLSEMQQYRNDIVLLPNPISLNSYLFQPRSAPKPNLIWLRAIAAVYNPKLAVEVVYQLQNEFKDIHLTLIGPIKEDETFRQFQEKAAELGVERLISLPGGIAKAEVPHQLQKGDIFLNTTNIDNTPVSVIEAMACGLCIVSTDVGGISYLLEHEHNALLVPPDNSQAMADAVRRILSEPGLAERLSRNARTKVERFDWSLILPQWEAMLHGVIEQRCG